jgi:endonuclease G, mitochondrial
MRRLLSAAFAFAFAISVSAAPANCPAKFFDGQAPDLINGKLATKAQPRCFSQFAVLHAGLTRTPR